MNVNRDQQIDPTIMPRQQTPPTRREPGAPAAPTMSSAVPRSQTARRKRRWSTWAALLAICLVIFSSLQPYVAAAFDPAHRAQVSVERVRAAEKVLAARLAAIKTHYGEDHADKLMLVVNSADDFHSASDALRDMGEWLLQERGRIEADMLAYVAALESAQQRILKAIEHNEVIVQQYPESSEFRAHYQRLSVEYLLTAGYLQQRVSEVRTQQQELDRSMNYIAEVLRFLDRMQIHVDVVSIRNSDEARRVERYLSTLTQFKSHFQEMMSLLGDEHVSDS